MKGAISILRQQEDWVGGSVLLTFRTLFTYAVKVGGWVKKFQTYADVVYRIAHLKDTVHPLWHFLIDLQAE